MAVRISELNELKVGLSTRDIIAIVDVSAGETKRIRVENLLEQGIAAISAGSIDLSRLDQDSETKLVGSKVLASTGAPEGSYGSASQVSTFTVNLQGQLTNAASVDIAIDADAVTGLASVAYSGEYDDLLSKPSLGTISPQNSDSIDISGGAISGVTFSSDNVTISGGTITGITDLAIADGGTGASTEAEARVNLGLEIGVDVQAYNSTLSNVGSQFTVADRYIYSTASGVLTEAEITSYGRDVLALADAASGRTLLALGSIATQDLDSVTISGGTIDGVTFTSSDVTISGGTITDITDIAVADGGTGASSAADARTNLGVAIGSDVQAYHATLSGITENFLGADQYIYSSASGVIASGSITSVGRDFLSQSTADDARLSIGLGSISTQDLSAVAISGGTIEGVTLTTGNVTISGGTISGITDIAIADGGTGASDASGARTNLGLTIGSDVQAYSVTLSGLAEQFVQEDTLVYTATSGVVASSALTAFGRSLVDDDDAATARSTLGLGSIATQEANAVSISGGTISGVTIESGDVTISGGTITGITDITIADGGTGASTASAARTNLGVEIGSDVQGYSATLSGLADLYVAADQYVYASASGTVTSGTISSFGRDLLEKTTASGVREHIGNGSISTQDFDNVIISGGTIDGVTFSSASVAISGGTISGITDLAIEDGGTGASSAEDARTNLGLVISTDIQAHSSILDGVVSQAAEPDRLFYTSASGVIGSINFDSFGQSLVSGDASSARTALGLDSLAQQDHTAVAISGGTVSGVTLISSDVTISSGTITGIEDLAVGDGGTGASTAEDARTNLGLSIGTDVQAYSVVLSGLSDQYQDADKFVYSTAADTLASADITAYGRSLIDDADASTARTTLELGTISTQDANAVDITGGTISGSTIITSDIAISSGTITGIQDLAVADGGTGASTAGEARTNLGVGIGSDVQAYSVVLSGVSEQFTAADQLVYSTASGAVASSTITEFGRTLVSQASASGMRSNLGVGDMALQEPNSVAITGGSITGITDLAIADGGTGGSTAADARQNLGLEIGVDVQAYDATLESLSSLTTSSGQLVYTDGSESFQAADIEDYARTFLASGSSASDARNYLGLGALATEDVVTSDLLDAEAVASGAIASGAVQTVHYAAGSVDTAALGDSAVTAAKIADSGVTAIKLANNSATIVAEGAPLTDGTFTGQRYIDTNTDFSYTWQGTEWIRDAGITTVTFADTTPLSFAVAYPDEYSATITTTLDTQEANLVFAGPASGVDAAPTFRDLVSADLPVATSDDPGAVSPGTGLQVDGAGELSHTNEMTAGNYVGQITVDSQGHVTAANAELAPENIPGLDASKIITGTFASEFLAENSVTAQQLADYGIAQVSESAPTPEFAGQWWVNPNDRAAYIWVGSVSPVPEGYWLNLGYGSPTQINLRFGGTYDASNNTVTTINSYGIEAGLTVGQALSSPNTSNNGVYLIVTSSGVGATPAPSGSILSVGNWLLSQGVGDTWTEVDLGSAVQGVGDQDILVDGTSFTPVATGVASQEDFNEMLWYRVQTASASQRGIIKSSSSIAVSSSTGVATVATVDDGTY